MAGETITTGCLHCGSPVPEGSDLGSFCCAGCRAVYSLLRADGLTRYYDLAGSRRAPVPELPRSRNFAWLDPILEAGEAGGGPLCSVELDVQGIHCAACVWLLNELFRRRGGGASVTVNPGLGKVRLVWRRGAFDVRAYLAEVERFGYLFGPSRKAEDPAEGDLFLRLGICAGLSLFVMIFAEGFYFGLTPEDGEPFVLFSRLGLVLCALVVLIGGWVFIRSAWEGLRRGLLHLDLPIAVGILLAFGLSLVQARSGRGDRAYLDALAEFVTLMLAGRWVQRRLLTRNRRFLLESDGARSVQVRRREGDRLVTVRAPDVREGDLLVLAPGDLAPVDVELLDEAAAVSTEWITGEPGTRPTPRGATLPAGAFNAGAAAVQVRARTGFEGSGLAALLRQPPRDPSRAPAHARLWSVISKGYVLAVLGLAVASYALALPRGAEHALEATVALLVVTCPCAIGLAIPLAYEIVLARLRRAGLFVRSADLLDRLARVRKLLFDKTGTLTLRRLSLANPEALAALPPQLRDAAYEMVARSNHPVSRCLADALERLGARLSGDARVVEVPGHGLVLERDGHVYRLGEAGWAAGASGVQATAFAEDGQLRALLRTTETPRAGSRAELAALQRAGHEVWILSGDEPARVEALARCVGVSPERARGGLTPEEKAAAVARLDEGDTLFFGDGINDSLAFERALCAGTPAIDHPVVPAKADFFLLGEGLAALGQALGLARRLRVTVRGILVLGGVYNVAALAACLAGLMTPLWAAVAMPVSSVSLLVFTIASLSPRRPARPAAPAPAGALEGVPAWTP